MWYIVLKWVNTVGIPQVAALASKNKQKHEKRKERYRREGKEIIDFGNEKPGIMKEFKPPVALRGKHGSKK